MFPLGCVLFPHAVLPLHVFEPRYRALARDCLAGDRALGIVLIERGSEVGGGDTRFSVGTLAHIAQHQELPDGRSVLLLVGVERIRVSRWLPDEPYPRAEVIRLDDVGPGRDAAELRTAVESRVRRALAIEAELGEPAAPATLDFDADPSVASYQFAAGAPIGPADAQRVLEVDGTDARLRLLLELLDDELRVLAYRLSGQ